MHAVLTAELSRVRRTDLMREAEHHRRTTAAPRRGARGPLRYLRRPA